MLPKLEKPIGNLGADVDLRREVDHGHFASPDLTLDLELSFCFLPQHPHHAGVA